MALQSNSYSRTDAYPARSNGMTLRFPKEMVTQSLWAHIAELGWTQYVISDATNEDVHENKTMKAIKLPDDVLQKARSLSVGDGYNVPTYEDDHGAVKQCAELHSLAHWCVHNSDVSN